MANDSNSTDDKKVGIRSYGNGGVSINGLTPEEAQFAMGSLQHGAHWIRNVDGRLEVVNAHTAFPNPVEDVEMTPFWQKPAEREMPRENHQLKLFCLQELSKYSSPSISIEHLCAYEWTPEGYAHEANKLKSWGFDIMRSPRARDGKFWEKWYLPGLWAAEGDLKDAIADKRGDNKAQLDAAVEFLRDHSIFGTLDVSVQRLAMSHPD